MTKTEIHIKYRGKLKKTYPHWSPPVRHEANLHLPDKLEPVISSKLLQGNMNFKWLIELCHVVSKNLKLFQCYQNSMKKVYKPYSYANQS